MEPSKIASKIATIEILEDWTVSIIETALQVSHIVLIVDETDRTSFPVDKEEHPCQSMTLIKLQSNFIEMTLRHGCSPVNLRHIFRTPFTKNTSGWLNDILRPGSWLLTI